MMMMMMTTTTTKGAPCSVRLRHSTPLLHGRRLVPTQCADPLGRRARVPRAATASPPGFTESPPQKQRQHKGKEEEEEEEEEEDKGDESSVIGGFDNSSCADLGYTREDWRGEFKSVEKEQSYCLDSADITGSIPDGLRGVYYRNGPGRFDTADGRPLKHPLDGDGHVLSVEIEAQDRVRVTNRFVRTEGYVAEQKIQKSIYRNMFGTEPEGQLASFLNINLKNTANTNLIIWGKGEARKMLALWEGSHPYRLDEKSLDTLGLDHLDNVLGHGFPLSTERSTGSSTRDALLGWLMQCHLGGRSFCAHPHVDPKTNHMVAFSLQTLSQPFGDVQSDLQIFEFNDAWEVISRKQIMLDGVVVLHDFCLTDDYYVVMQSSVKFRDMHRFLAGSKSPSQCMAFDDSEPCKVFFVPRWNDTPPIVGSLPPVFVFHHANAFQEAADPAHPEHLTITVQSVSYSSLPDIGADIKTDDFRDMDFKSQPRSLLHEATFRIHEAKGTAELVNNTQLMDQCVEFPSVHPQLFGQRARFIYSGCSRHPREVRAIQGFLKYDRQHGTSTIFTKGSRCFCQEPVFVPRSSARQGCDLGEDEEDDGWLLGLVYNAAVDRSELWIVDAKTMEEVACVRLKTPMPFGLHATWEWAE